MSKATPALRRNTIRRHAPSEGRSSGGFGRPLHLQELETRNLLSGSGSISGTVWFDQNRDGVQNENEQGIGGVEVTLVPIDAEGLEEVTVTTDENGNYEFDNVSGGAQFEIEFRNLPDGESRNSEQFEFDGESPPAGTDLGYIPSESWLIEGTAWLDSNGDGVFDEDETGLPDLMVDVIYAGADGDFDTELDNLVFSLLTGEDGSYAFSFLPGGEYRVVPRLDDLPLGFEPTNVEGGTQLFLNEGTTGSSFNFGFFFVPTSSPPPPPPAPSPTPEPIAEPTPGIPNISLFSPNAIPPLLATSVSLAPFPQTVGAGSAVESPADSESTAAIRRSRYFTNNGDVDGEAGFRAKDPAGLTVLDVNIARSDEEKVADPASKGQWDGYKNWIGRVLDKGDQQDAPRSPKAAPRDSR